MVAIFPIDDAAAALGQQSLAIAEVPTLRPLQQLAANRALSPQRIAIDAAYRLVDGGKLVQFRRFEQFIQRRDCADRDAERIGLDAAQVGHARDIDDAPGRHDHLGHEWHKIGAARQERRLLRVVAEQFEHTARAGRSRIFKGFHQAFLASKASRTRLGVMGRTGTRTPSALATAFEMAAPGLMTGGSPRPTTPRSYSLSGS